MDVLANITFADHIMHYKMLTQTDSECAILVLKEYLFLLGSQMRQSNVVERVPIWKLKRFGVLTSFWHLLAVNKLN